MRDRGGCKTDAMSRERLQSLELIDRRFTAQNVNDVARKRRRGRALRGRGVPCSARGLAWGAEPGQKQDERVVARTFVSLRLGTAKGTESAFAIA